VSTDSMLDTFTRRLQPEREPERRSDGYAGPREDLRLPNKLLISGIEVISRISSELSTGVKVSGGDDLMGSTASLPGMHPSLQTLCDALPGHLSAFDRCIGETQGWNQKYAPTTALEVLQPSSKMAILKDWLLSLKVNTVEAALPHSPHPKYHPNRRRSAVDKLTILTTFW
jgi:hypothetical protein